MWAKFMTVENGYVAQVWKELYDAEGVAVRVVPPLTGARTRWQLSRARSGCRTPRRTSPSRS